MPKLGNTVWNVTLEKSTEIPRPKGHHRYFWHSLAVSTGSPPKGPYFLVACEEYERQRVWDSLTRCKNSVERNYPPKKYVTRAMPGGIGVWRVK